MLFRSWNQYRSGQNRPSYQTSAAVRGTIRNTVSATGPIVNPVAVGVTFKNAGRLATVNVSVGDPVVAGQVLAQLDTRDLQSSLEQERARLRNLEATEETTRIGPTVEQIDVARATLASAEAQYQSALDSLDAARNASAAAIENADAGVQGSTVGLRNAQRSADATENQSAATIAAAQTDLNNARTDYADALRTFETTVNETQASIAAGEETVRNAAEALAAAQAAEIGRAHV